MFVKLCKIFNSYMHSVETTQCSVELTTPIECVESSPNYISKATLTPLGNLGGSSYCQRHKCAPHALEGRRKLTC